MKKYFATKLTENIHKTPEGFLICYNVPIARTGEMEYGPGESPVEVGPDGKAIVSREAKEVFRPETIASFEGKPFTITHPEEFVNPSNWKVLAKGSIQNVRRGTGANENDLMADILITDAEAIKLVEGGIREVSCGYEAEYIQTGVGRGMQTNIIGNHLALVEAGRAGTAYAINDQKGAKMKNLGDKIKGIFAKAGDEAAKVVDESSKEGTAAKEETADEKAPAWATKLEKTMARVADGLEQVASMSQPSKYGDEEKEDKDDKKAADDKADGDEEKKDDKAADEGEEKKVDDAMESRFAKLEDAVAKLCDAMGLNEESEDEEGEEEEEEEEESEDNDFEETPAAAVGDEKARIEILAPGLKAKGKDAKRMALIEAYKSKDNKAIIDRMNGGKAPDLKKASQKTIDHLFIGASEVVGLYRTKNFTKWKQVRDSQDETGANEPMTPEKINELNEKHYAQKGVH